MSVALMNMGMLVDFVREARLPPFQRAYVWTPEQAERLIDSVVRGWPVGAILAWRPSRQSFWGPGRGDWILDGQQRLTALTGYRPGGELVHVVAWNPDDMRWHVYSPDDVPAGVVRFGAAADEVLDLYDRWPSEVRVAYSKHYDGLRFQSQIPVHGVGGSLEEAVEAFRRINLGGTPITAEDLAQLVEVVA